MNLGLCDTKALGHRTIYLVTIREVPPTATIVNTSGLLAHWEAVIKIINPVLAQETENKDPNLWGHYREGKKIS